MERLPGMVKKVSKVNVFDPLQAATFQVLRDALFVASPTVAAARIPCTRVVVVRAKPGACTALWFEIDERFGVFHGGSQPGVPLLEACRRARQWAVVLSVHFDDVPF